jgi:hypothetical protein
MSFPLPPDGFTKEEDERALYFLVQKYRDIVARMEDEIPMGAPVPEWIHSQEAIRTAAELESPAALPYRAELQNVPSTVSGVPVPAPRPVIARR